MGSARTLQLEPEPLPAEGDLASTPFAVILGWARANRATGVLSISGEKFVFLLKGTPVHVDSVLEDETSEVYLKTRKVAAAADEEKLAAAREAAQESGGGVGEAMLSLGWLDPSELFEHKKAHTREKLISCFNPRAGSIRFEPREAFGSELLPIPIDVAEAMREGFGRFYDRARLDRELPIDDLCRVVVTQRAAQATVTEEARLLQLAAAQPTIRALATAVGMRPDELKRHLYALYCLGLVAFELGAPIAEESPAEKGMAHPFPVPRAGVAPPSWASGRGPSASARPVAPEPAPEPTGPRTPTPPVRTATPRPPTPPPSTPSAPQGTPRPSPTTPRHATPYPGTPAPTPPREVTPRPAATTPRPPSTTPLATTPRPPGRTPSPPGTTPRPLGTTPRPLGTTPRPTTVTPYPPMQTPSPPLGTPRPPVPTPTTPRRTPTTTPRPPTQPAMPRAIAHAKDTGPIAVGKLTEQASRSLEAAIEAAELARANDEMIEAVDILRSADRELPHEPKILAELALTLILFDERKFAKEANRLAREARTAAPSLPLPYVVMGILLEQINEGEQAAQMYRHALARDPDCAEASRRLAALAGGFKATK